MQLVHQVRVPRQASAHVAVLRLAAVQLARLADVGGLRAGLRSVFLVVVSLVLNFWLQVSIAILDGIPKEEGVMRGNDGAERLTLVSLN